MRHLFNTLFLLIAAAGYSQCGAYMHHPVWPDTVGSAYVNPTDCTGGGAITGCVWDNGDTSWDTDGLSVGAHTVVLYAEAVPVETLNFQIEQLEWDLNQQVFMYAGELAVSVYAEVPYCPSQLFNNHHCPIDPDSTLIYLLQDGVAIDSITSVSCLGMPHQWSFLPSGYTYQTYLVDRTACGSYAYGEAVASFSLDDAEIEYLAEPSTGSNNGTITVTDVVPAPGTLSPPPMPLSGNLTLYTWPDEIAPVGSPQQGSSGYWEGLAPGLYWLVFTPDVLCNSVDTVITIDAFTGVEGVQGNGSSALRIWPVPATDLLFWSGGVQTLVRVTDLQGRMVHSARNAVQLDVSSLAPGAYQVHFGDGRRMPFVKR